MTFTTDAATKRLIITLSGPQYALMLQALHEPAALERLLLSHLQRMQSEQDSQEREALHNSVEAVPKAQRQAVLGHISDLRRKG